MKKTKTERRIIRAFCQLLLETPLDEIAIQEIIEKAEISRSTFYNYFHSKEELIDTTLRFATGTIKDILSKDPLLKKPIIVEMLREISDNREFYYPLVVAFPNADAIAKEYIADTVVNSAIENLDQQLENNYRIPNRFAMEVYVHSVHSIIVTWIRDNFIETPEQVADIIFETILLE